MPLTQVRLRVDAPAIFQAEKSINESFTKENAMTLSKILATIIFAGLLFVAAPGRDVLAQSADQPAQAENREDETNLDTQLYLLIATNQQVDDSRLPPALEPVMKQLRASLPFKNYRLGATLINRVKNNGRLNLKWLGAPLVGSTAGASKGTFTEFTPSFSDFRINLVKLSRDAAGQPVVRMEGFGFGSRIPIQTGTTLAANGSGAPIINYESTGLNTDISMRENEPVIVGTLNVGPSGDAIILVMTARRSSR